MSFSGQVLADGQLPSSAGTLYTVPADTITYLKYVNLFNTDAATQTIVLYLNVSGTDRAIRRFELEENESADLLDVGQSLHLEVGDTIRAVSTDAMAVDYVITGIEEDIS